MNSERVIRQDKNTKRKKKGTEQKVSDSTCGETGSPAD